MVNDMTNWRDPSDEDYRISYSSHEKSRKSNQFMLYSRFQLMLVITAIILSIAKFYFLFDINSRMSVAIEDLHKLNERVNLIDNSKLQNQIDSLEKNLLILQNKTAI